MGIGLPVPLLDAVLLNILAMSQQNEPIRGLSKVWLTNKISATLIIPIDLARKYDLNEPSRVVLEERPEEKGILIKKLKI